MSTEVRYSRLFLRPTAPGEEHTPTDRIVTWKRLGGMWVSEDYPLEMWACEHPHRTEAAARVCKRWR